MQSADGRLIKSNLESNRHNIFDAKSYPQEVLLPSPIQQIQNQLTPPIAQHKSPSLQNQIQISLCSECDIALILLMEAIIERSRSIPHNTCYQRETESNYRRHVDTIKLLKGQKSIFLEQKAHEVKHLSTLLQKSKSAAKSFREKEDKSNLKSENTHLLKKIWYIEPTIKTHNNDDKFQYVSGSNRAYQQRRQAEIKDENKRIGRKMLLQKLEVPDFKNKLKAEIKDYIELRDSIRRIKNSSEGKIKRTLSENKIKIEKRKPSTDKLAEKQKEDVKNAEKEAQQSPIKEL